MDRYLPARNTAQPHRSDHSRIRCELVAGALAAELPEGRSLSGVDGPDGGSADVGEHQPADTHAGRTVGGVQRGGVAADALGEANRIPPPRRVGQSHTNGMPDESGHARCLSRPHEFADRTNLIVRQGDGDLGRCHTKNHTIKLHPATDSPPAIG